jgi:hypothetical protein
MNPIDPFPIAIRAAFIFEKNAAATAHGAEVPLIPNNSFGLLDIMTWYRKPASDISG